MRSAAYPSLVIRDNNVVWRHPLFDHILMHVVSEYYCQFSTITVYKWSANEHIHTLLRYDDGTVSHAQKPRSDCLEVWFTDKRGTEKVCKSCPVQLTCLFG